jgi:uncharacterized protein (DUF2267 family)
MAEVRDFNTAAQSAEVWVDDLTSRLAWHDRDRAYMALLATLHALRDCVGRDEAVFLGAQLPALLRGLYYEGWHPGNRATTRKRDAFLARVHDGVRRDPAVDPEQVARAVLALLVARLSAAEVEDAKTATPRELHNLWPS